MAKTLNLHVVSRLFLTAWLDEFAKKSGHGLSSLAVLIDVLKKVQFTDQEKKDFEIVVGPRMIEVDGQQVVAKDHNGMPFIETRWGKNESVAIECSDSEAEMVYNLIKSMDEEKRVPSQGFEAAKEVAEQVGYKF